METQISVIRKLWKFWADELFIFYGGKSFSYINMYLKTYIVYTIVYMYIFWRLLMMIPGSLSAIYPYPGIQQPFRKWWFLFDDKKPLVENWWFGNQSIRNGGWISMDIVNDYTWYIDVHHTDRGMNYATQSTLYQEHENTSWVKVGERGFIRRIHPRKLTWKLTIDGL